MSWRDIETMNLSDGAVDLFRRRYAGEWVEVTDENRPFYRELAGAGLMAPHKELAKPNRDSDSSFYRHGL